MEPPAAAQAGFDKGADAVIAQLHDGFRDAA